MITVFGSKVGQLEIDQVTDSLNNQWLGMGPKVKAFEEKFAKRLDLEHFTMVDSGSNALFLACALLDLPKGSEIILPSFTWVSCAQSILLAGHKPVFCDVDTSSMNVTAELIQSHVTENTGAIMVVHYAGLPVDMDPILKLGYPVIEDAAHAVDSHYKGIPCGGISDIGIYSFDGVKNLTVGEGGGLTTKSAEHHNRAKMLRYCGIGKSGFEASTHGQTRWWEYNIAEPFIKMLPSDIAGAIGLGQIARLDELQAYRKQIWEHYQEQFKDDDWIITPEDALKENKHSYFTYAIRVPQGKRDALAHYLFDNDIYSTLRYHPLHLNPVYKQLDKKLVNCEELNETALSIPLHPNLTDEDVEKIVTTIKSFKAKL